jgi:crossover junction endodeoxyribonuclease RuvC
MKILGIDPGSNYLGLACVEAKGNNLRCIGHAAVHVSADTEKNWSERLKNIFLAVQSKIELWQPEVVSVEEVFFAKNAQSALKLGQARGAAIAAAAVVNLPIHEYAPTLIKQSLTSSGRADKNQVESMVRLILGASLKQIGEPTRHDATDALAIAICHAQQNRFEKRIQFGSLEASR